MWSWRSTAQNDMKASIHASGKIMHKTSQILGGYLEQAVARTAFEEQAG